MPTDLPPRKPPTNPSVGLIGLAIICATIVAIVWLVTQ